MLHARVSCVLPLRPRTDAEAHVPLLRERVIPQLPQVLGGQILVRVPRHRIVTWRAETHRAEGIKVPFRFSGELLAVLNFEDE